MNNIIESLFPLRIYLHILQLEEYRISGLLKWMLVNFFTRKLQNKKPLVWSVKARFLFLASVGLTVILPLLILALSGNLAFSILALALLVLQPYIPLAITRILLFPYESIYKNSIFTKTQEKIKRLNTVKVIGITGSFGKTSVKDILYQMLRKKYKVLKTPKSYNTLMSIAKVVDLELDKTYDFFICEMGAYKKGEIAQICRMVKPKYGILTGIGEQHLERFGSLQNIIEAKFELSEALPAQGFLTLNGDSKLVIDNLARIKTPYTIFGIENPNAQVQAENLRINKFVSCEIRVNWTAFRLKIGQKTTKVKTALLGKGSVQNILAATALAYKLGVLLEDIKTVIETLEPTPNRLELLKKQNMLILNNTYSSNPEGFREAVSIASNYRKRQRILVTPGIVELGKRTEPIHKELGKLAGEVFDIVILIGKNKRTKALEKGLRQAKYLKSNIIYVTSLFQAQQLLPKISKPNSFILFENDLPDNY